MNIHIYIYIDSYGYDVMYTDIYMLSCMYIYIYVYVYFLHVYIDINIKRVYVMTHFISCMMGSLHVRHDPFRC